MGFQRSINIGACPLLVRVVMKTEACLSHYNLDCFDRILFFHGSMEISYFVAALIILQNPLKFAAYSLKSVNYTVFSFLFNCDNLYQLHKVQLLN